MYGIKGIDRLLKEIKEREEKAKTKKENKLRGYAPKCTICNSPYLDEIEKLREENYTYQDIIYELDLDCSMMALSRHFKNHYPQSQAYKNKQEIQMLENIKEAYQEYPFLEDYFKDKDLSFLEKFNKEYGFCTDKFGLCRHLEASTVSNGNDNVTLYFQKAYNEIEDLKNSSYRWSIDKEEINNIKTKHHTFITNCLNCKNQIQEDRITLLEKIITYNFLGIPPENKELYFNLLQYDGNPEEFIETLTKISKE